MNCKTFSTLLLALCVSGAALKVSAQGTAFLYQGRLNDNGNAANGSYDLRFALYDAATNGSAISLPQTNFASAVSGGLLTATLDFGAVFKGTNYWLSVGVRTNGNTNAFTLLWPRQPLLPVPYAVFATGASNLLGTLATTQLVGTLPAGQISGSYPGTVNFPNSTNSFSGSFTGSFSGDGISLANLNASALATGTVADARLTPNVALLDRSQTFTAANAFTNPTNSFTGSFFGNGLVGWIPVSGTVTQAVRDTGYLLLNAFQTTVTLPTTASLLMGDIVRISGAGSGGWKAALNAGQSALGNFASYRGFFWLLASVPGTGNWSSLAASADGTVMWAAGNISSGNGGIYFSADSGKTWSQINNLSGSWNAVACSSDGTKVFAASSNGFIQKSTDGGKNWTALSGASGIWRSIACSADASKMIAAKSSGFVYVLSGTTLVQTTLATGSWTATAAASDGTHLAAAKGNVVYVSSDGGANWGYATVGTTVTSLAASADGLKLVAALLNGSISTSINFGTNWTTSGSTSRAWNCLAASSDCTRILAGVSNGLLYASSDFGATWAAFSTSSNLVWSALAASSDGVTSAAGASGIGTGTLYYSAATSRTATSTTNSISGGQGAAVELQYIGNNQFMPVSSTGILWAN